MVFKNWSLRMLIYSLILSLILAYLMTRLVVVASSFGLKSETSLDINVLIFAFSSTIFYYLGIVFLIISFVKKELKDYKFYLAFFGYLLSFLVFLINYFYKFY